ncbi:hypothetical protein C8R45DRAFT_926414 [Mycena sanguinolenta]|nr:hypothetical protein C8R45DRAFT_926414 [Mycena sanguinolenta]
MSAVQPDPARQVPLQNPHYSATLHSPHQIPPHHARNAYPLQGHSSSTHISAQSLPTAPQHSTGFPSGQSATGFTTAATHPVKRQAISGSDTLSTAHYGLEALITESGHKSGRPLTFELISLDADESASAAQPRQVGSTTEVTEVPGALQRLGARQEGEQAAACNALAQMDLKESISAVIAREKSEERARKEEERKEERARKEEVLRTAGRTAPVARVSMRAIGSPMVDSEYIALDRVQHRRQQLQAKQAMLVGLSTQDDWNLGPKARRLVLEPHELCFLEDTDKILLGPLRAVAEAFRPSDEGMSTDVVPPSPPLPTLVQHIAADLEPAIEEEDLSLQDPEGMDTSVEEAEGADDNEIGSSLNSAYMQFVDQAGTDF